MAIKKIKISNFKSFGDLEIGLGKFNVLIGANASGKSNFIQIFKFLRDITNHGLDNAISMQGGVEYLRNINIGSSENLSLEVVSDLKYRRPVVREKGKKMMVRRTYETIYRFVMEFKKRGSGFEIVEDKLTQKFDIYRLEIQKKKIEKREKLWQGEITISNVKGKINVDSLKLPEDVPIKEDDIFPSFLRGEKLEPRTPLLEWSSFFPISPIFGDISIYDFDPKLPKKATPITGKAEIEEDGSNLAIVLKNIIENKDKERKFSNLVKDLLPFVDELDP